jgi:hypothetical protein
MSKWIVSVTLGLCVTVSGAAFAQDSGKTLTEKDRADIRQLSDNYVTFLDGCKAAQYAGLFAADGSFVSGPRGTMTGREKLESLVTSEPFCKPNAPARSSAMSHAFSKVVIEPTADGASGKVYLPGREANTSGGHYEDVYVKTAAGWKFKSRTYLSPKEEAAAAQSSPVK